MMLVGTLLAWSWGNVEDAYNTAHSNLFAHYSDAF